MELPVIKDVSPEFQYVILGLVVFWISTKVIQAKASHLFALYVAAGLIYYLHTRNITETLNFNEETKYKYTVLGSPSHFHYDTNLINLFYNIYNWRAFDENTFDNAIKSANNVLKIEADSEKPLQRCVDNYDVARDQAKLTINLIHSFNHTLDNPTLLKKLENVLTRLQMLMERHLDKIKENCQITESRKESVDVHTRFIQDDKGVKAYDPRTNEFFDVY